MNRNIVLGLVVITSAFVGVAVAAEPPSKKPDAVGVPASGATASVPKAESIEANTKRPNAFKWDQVDPKAIEAAAKKAQSKSPFSAVPAER